MPTTALTPVTTSAGGTVWPAASAVDAANGNHFVNTGREWIEIINGAATPVTATITTYGTYTTSGGSSYAIADNPVIVANGTTRIVGPFETALYNNPTSGVVEIAWSSGVTITARVGKLGVT